MQDKILSNDFVILGTNARYAVDLLGTIIFNGEEIHKPTEKYIRDNIITLEVFDKETGQYNIETYIVLHTAKNGKKIITEFVEYAYLLEHELNKDSVARD